MGEQMALMPIPTDAERILLARLSDARAEIAVLRVQLAASWEREKAMDAANRDLRRELLEAHDVAGRAEGMLSPGSQRALTGEERQRRDHEKMWHAIRTNQPQ